MRWVERILQSLRRGASLGERGELLAAKHLRRNGYRILERNTKLGAYEIDIIAREGDTIAFVEVKTRQGDPYADPEANITPTKMRHLRRAAGIYLAHHDNPEYYYRFDVVTVVIPGSGAPEIALYRDAFPGE